VAETLSANEERDMMTAVKKSSDFVEEGMAPDDAVEKVAREMGFGPGRVRILAYAHNTGKQLAQMRESTGAIDKFAAFDIADPEKVISRMYPKEALTKKAESVKTGVDSAYSEGPWWLPKRDNVALPKETSAIFEKAAADEQAFRERPRGDSGDNLRKKYAAYEEAKITYEEKRRLASRAEDNLTVKVAALCTYFRQPLEHRLPLSTAEMICTNRHGRQVKPLFDLVQGRVKIASREKRGADFSRRVIRRAVMPGEQPFSLVESCLKAAADLVPLRYEVESAKNVFDKEAANAFGPFVLASRRGALSPPTTPGTKTASFTPLSMALNTAEIAAGDILGGSYLEQGKGKENAQETLSPEEEDQEKTLQTIHAEGDIGGLVNGGAFAKFPRQKVVDAYNHAIRANPKLQGNALHEEMQSRLGAPKAPSNSIGNKGAVKASSEKRGIFGTPAMGAAVGTGIARMVGDVPKSKADMIEDQWLDLEDPQHQNELRKIKAHAMLTGMLTDPESSLSGHDPDEVIRHYNEISSMAPRVAEQPAAVRPLLERRMQGNVQPFEAKEVTDIEKGIAQSRVKTPSGGLLNDAPDSIMG
jgi:hypothetical protein